MGLFGDIIGGIGKFATSIIPGPVDDIIFEAGKSLFGGGESRVGVQRVRTPPIVRRSAPRLPQIQLQQSQEVIKKPGVRGVIERTLPGGKTGFITRGGVGMPMIGQIAVEPEVKSVDVRDCPTGMVLAIDGLCYPKQMVPKKWRMWKPEPRPVVSRADQKAIQRADRAKKRLVNLTKKAGAHASLTKPRRRS